MEQESPRDELLDKPLHLTFLVVIPVYAGGILALLVFPAAGDWRWLEGWAYILTFAFTMTICTAIINKRNPRVLRNRMKVKKEGLTDATKTSAGSDRFIVPAMGVGFCGALIVPGLDHRWGWSSVPVAVEIIGLLLTNAGLILMNVAMLQNSYASKLLDINKDQVLIDTGLYAHVRHPLYAGALWMVLAMPVALGSWWGLIPTAFAILSIAVRIRFEEEMLIQGMDGYEEYQMRVRYKLIPGIY